MKRTATTLVLLAGLGGGCASTYTQPAPKAGAQTAGGFGTVTRGRTIDNLQGPMGEPVMMTAGAPVMQAGGTSPKGYVSTAGGVMVPGAGGNIVRASGGFGAPGFGASGPYGPQLPHQCILPVPSMGPPGAVAAFGALGVPGGARPPMANGRSSIKFTGPAGMKVTWQLPDGSFSNDKANALTPPKEYNFLQGQVYRLRLSEILPEYAGVNFYPTLEVASGNPKTLVFLSHASVPLTFTADDFAQAKAGNLVVKVVYLPDPSNQDFSTAVGAEEVVSTRLEPGADPVAEAQRRGSVLAIIRLGNIDLENPTSPAMNAPPPGALFGPPPGAMGPPPVAPKSVEPPKGPAPKGGATAPKNPPGTASVSGAPSKLPDLPLGPVAPLPPKK
jgi:hypothetical protein